ncbi:hypothetical protein GCU56_02860 [Geodermatophilus sabuli]|uniref:Uncharacterized protein n=1 Tax=Geodermatophilus sabuli TaxID=1564158 RepID=A0A7K3VW40_9ACTN|nr:hypothetical protein [Geodermatophilus sabuli]NEK56812.1 hypothetical protein [Geodermatophilus sabuli]
MVSGLRGARSSDSSPDAALSQRLQPPAQSAEPIGVRMPRYRYTSPWPEVFTDLEVGRDARVIPRDGRALPALGSTVILLPGDEIDLSAAYEHGCLTEVDRPTAAAEAAAVHLQPDRISR